MTFHKGKRLYDLTEADSGEETSETTPLAVDQTTSYPTPSQFPEASSSQPQTNLTPNRITKPLPRSESTEASTRAIDRSIKIKVAIALLVEGKRNLNRERLCQEVSLFT
jgi:hypothetical protein